ncbi:unnamed protein product [Spodoptera exigua]|nr:unnamed protein product [Spodoptera exigua]
MTEQLKIQTNVITENITAVILQKVDEKLKPIIEENQNLRNEVNKLNNKLINLEANTKRKNVIIHGLPEPNEESHEQLTTLVTSTLKEIEVNLEIGEIDRLQRLGKKRDNDVKIRPILLATTTLGKKIQILKNKKKMKSGTYITHDLPKAVLQAKTKNLNTNKDSEKRKRSDTPSPNQQNKSTSKLPKINTFQHLRERSHSTSGTITYKN